MNQKKDNLIISTDEFKALKERMWQAATQIRKAVMEKRPIIISHHGDCDGYAAGILLERAIMPLIEKHNDSKYTHSYFARNPSRTPYYDVIDATKDIGSFLLNMERNRSKAPLILIVDNGSTPQDLLAIRKTKIYGADHIVVDHHDPGQLDDEGKSAVCKEVSVHVNPHLVGFSKELSASMLCYQLAYFINSKHNVNAFTAALGGVSDRCEGKAVDFLVEKAEQSRDYLQQLGFYVDYEIFNTKMNLARGGIFTLLDGTQEMRDKLVNVYEEQFKKDEADVFAVLEKYHVKEELGTFTLYSIDGEQTTLWSDYFSIGKIAGMLHQQHEGQRITMAHSNNIIVFRAEVGFSVNKLIVELKEKIPYARISGGGHDVAGSIKFVSAAKDDVVATIKKHIQSL